MPPVTDRSPVTGQPVSSSYIHASSAHFQDNHGRAILLRGVNLSGGAKAPQDRPSWRLDGFWEDGENGTANFVNRPLNLDDGSADVHLARLRAWGFNMLRYVFTWEAIEHAGPGKYDEDYLDYVVKVMKKCKEWGFKVFMDPHQDVWSRYSGGSGAPLWTLYACGIDPRHISQTYGALINCEFPDRENPVPSQYPGMIWGTNYTRLVSQTVFTMFYAGKEYTPKCVIDGKNIQDYLVDHFFGAVAALAKKLKAAGDLFDECVIGWDSMNEPGEGLVSHPDLARLNPELQLKKGPMPTPLEGFKMGMGQAVDVDDYYFGSMGPMKGKKIRWDPKGVRLWLDAQGERERGGDKWGWKRDPGWQLGTCVWALHGIWDPKTGKLLKPNYFATTPSKPQQPVNFIDDFWATHFIAYAKVIRSIHSEAILFVQPSVFKKPPVLPKSVLQERACSAPHFYDGFTLMTKHWNWFNADALGFIRGKYWSIVQAVRVGDAAIKQMMQEELATFKQDTKECLGDYPTLIGEIGCPFDMDEKKAYGYVDGGRGEGDYSMQRRAWDASLHALDGPNALNVTMWTYVPDNSHEWGDLWNGEDLSLWSADDLEKPSELDSSPDSPTPLARLNKSLSTLTLSEVLSGKLPASLLLDGSRAIEAICRPYPIALVGTPVNSSFDMYSSLFKLSVRVTSKDTVPEGVGSEVYLPFIHYAASLGSSSSGTAYTLKQSGSANNSRVSLLQYGQKKASEEKQLNSPTSTGSFAVNDDLTLSIDATPSTGRIELVGQTLKWYYAIPQSGEATYSLTVKRKGGPIKRVGQGYVQSGSWADVCPPDCVIA